MEDGWFVEKRRILGNGKTSFSVRAPLAAVVDVRASKPRIGLVGSSLTFTVSIGEELVFDVMAGLPGAEPVARRFTEAADGARRRSTSGPAGAGRRREAL